MEDGISVEENKVVKMGASDNPNAARLAVLKERKKTIEELLEKQNQALRQLCMQEAELTGTIPVEMPLEPGESLPTIRRRVGTAYQLPENLIQNTGEKDEITELEIQIQLHANLAEAALGLANENNTTKTVRRQHMAEYQKHKREYTALQEKLAALKEKMQQEQQLQLQQQQLQLQQQQQQQLQQQLQHQQQLQQQKQLYQQQMQAYHQQHLVVSEHKQKKKPRPQDQEDNISLATTLVTDPFANTDLRHSIRSMRHTLTGDLNLDQRYSTAVQPRPIVKRMENNYTDVPLPKADEVLSSGLYKLNINGFNNYVERRDNNNLSHTHQSQQYSQITEQSHEVLLSHNQNQFMQQQLRELRYHSPDSMHSSHSILIPKHTQQNSPRFEQHSPHVQQQSPHMQQHSPHIQQHSPHIQQHSPHFQYTQHYQQTSPHVQQYSPQSYHRKVIPATVSSQNAALLAEYKKYVAMPPPAPSMKNVPIRQQSSPSTSSSNSQKVLYYPSHTIHGQSSHRQYAPSVEHQYRTLNPHQLQPHQQYEHSMMSAGLGSRWKKMDNGEVLSNATDANWQREKRFGSLDRRRNKRHYKRMSPSADNKSATLASVPSYPEHIRTASVKSSQVVNRRSQDSRQLVRTQSLGSVGAQTADSVWPSDDNSSCESDNRSINELNQTLRKQKQKEWMETSLDGPVSPTHSVISRSQSALPSVLAPEEQYVVPTVSHQIPPPVPPPPVNMKPALEIPAESNPFPRVPEANIELFNNNIPKNCTVVQAGQCKPYHEETKPFEMSDYYKYSTKFKKSPVKQDPQNRKSTATPFQAVNVQKNLNGVFEEHASQTAQVTSPLNANTSAGRIDTSGSLNSSLDISQLAPNVAENFSAEMNAWYQNHERRDNNNDQGRPKNGSTATLV